ncbi:hypothetical protein HMI55_003236 [Coelomomyces lativittatus]|nr:hypothetical protein HMI55_003236 [Coelomomyces lativittatus]
MAFFFLSCIAYLSKGLAPSQLCIGVPFYGRGFAEVPTPNPGGSFQGVPQGTHEPGIYDFHHLLDMTSSSSSSSMWTLYHDATSSSHYLYSPIHRIWITYESQASLLEKLKYLKMSNLRGVFFWEASMDPKGTLVEFMHDVIFNQS